MSKPEPSKLMLEIGAKLYPRRYRRHRTLRPYQAACAWAQTLDWRRNPYDRFLLRRELLQHLESTECYEGRMNVFSFASGRAIGTEIDRLLDEFPDDYQRIGVFGYVLMVLPLNICYSHGQVRYSKLAQALVSLPSKAATE